MSLNQIGFFVLPKDCLDETSKNNNFELDENGYFDDELIWNKHKIHYSLFNEITEILPLNISWSKNIVLFGDENSNRLEVLFDKNEIILSVSFRLDFASNYEIILIKLLNFFKSNDLIVIDEKLNLTELKYSIFEEIISRFRDK
jgi:hypothetical protein